MAARWWFVLLVLVLAAAAAGAEKGEWDPVIRMPGEKEPAGSHSHSGEGFEGEDDDAVGTRWAVLVAGSSGYGNYRHQVSAILSAATWMRGCVRIRLLARVAWCCTVVAILLRQVIRYRGSEISIVEPWSCTFGYQV